MKPYKINPALALSGPFPQTSESFLETPAGLYVPPSAFESLVKAEARRQAAMQPDNRPRIMSKYTLLQNMQLWGAREKPVGTPQFADLYMAAERSFIDRIIIQARTDQSKMVWQRAVEGRQVGFRVVHDRHDDPSFKPTKDIQERCAEMEALLSDPTPVKYAGLYPHGRRVHDSLKDLISRLVQAELIIDRKVIYRLKRRDGKGYAAFHWLPGASVKPVHEAVKEWTERHDPQKKMCQAEILDRMSAQAGVDLWTCSYVQVMDGMIVAGFTDDEVSIHIANPSDREDRWGYGTSRLEISLDVTATLLYAWRYNQEIFKTNYPEAVLTVAGDFDKDGLEAFKRQLTGEGAGVGNNWRLPVIATPPGADPEQFRVETHKLRDTPKDLLFDQLLRMAINIKCAAYGAHPTIINFGQESGGGSGGSLFGHDPSSEIQFSREHGFRPHVLDLCAWLTDAIIKPRYDDLRLIIVGLDENSEKEQVDLVLSKGRNYLTRNEMRKMDNLPPIGDENDESNPWNYPADAPVSSYLTTMQTLAQMQ
jgi:hypothetical protein